MVITPPAKYPAPIVNPDITGLFPGEYLRLSKYPPNVMVNAPATAATKQAIMTVLLEDTNRLKPAAKASGMVSPSTSPIQMLR